MVKLRLQHIGAKFTFLKGVRIDQEGEEFFGFQFERSVIEILSHNAEFVFENCQFLLEEIQSFFYLKQL